MALCRCGRYQSGNPVAMESSPAGGKIFAVAELLKALEKYVVYLQAPNIILEYVYHHNNIQNGVCAHRDRATTKLLLYCRLVSLIFFRKFRRLRWGDNTH